MNAPLQGNGVCLGFTLRFNIHNMLSKLHCLVSKVHCLTNEQSSVDSLFRKGNAKLYLFHFGLHLVLSGHPEFLEKYSLPCAPWCTLRLGGAYRSLMVHEAPYTIVVVHKGD